MLMFAFLMIAVTFVTFFMFAFMLATFMFAFAFSFMLAAFMTFFALVFWHVGFHFLHFLCHADEICSLSFIEIFPVGESFNHSVHASHHFRAWSLMVVALMMFVALLFLVFAAFFSFFVFLFFAA